MEHSNNQRNHDVEREDPIMIYKYLCVQLYLAGTEKLATHHFACVQEWGQRIQEALEEGYRSLEERHRALLRSPAHHIPERDGDTYECILLHFCRLQSLCKTAFRLTNMAEAARRRYLHYHPSSLLSHQTFSWIDVDWCRAVVMQLPQPHHEPDQHEMDRCERSCFSADLKPLPARVVAMKQQHKAERPVEEISISRIPRAQPFSGLGIRESERDPHQRH